ncbi:MAG TPA: sulfite exporter TauE/SafE family protein [Macromonas sp.]|nr:sulfite exporter TauE/SafE family protein [Macromonas sp.]
MPAFALTDLLLMLCLGSALGFFGGLFGIGGGIIAIPLLGIGFGMDQAVAQGTALVMMVPNLLIAWLRYSQRHPVAWRTVLQIGVLACLTTWSLAQVATQLAPEVMRVVFGAFLLAMSLHMLVQLSKNAGLQPPVPRHLRWMPLVGVVGGSSMGLLGVGGGLLATPLFSAWFGQKQTVAQSLSLALVTPSAVIALWTYSHAHRVDWGVGLPLAVGGLFSVSAGVAVAHRLPEKRMRVAFACLVCGTGCWMLVKPLVLS